MPSRWNPQHCTSCYDWLLNLRFPLVLLLLHAAILFHSIQPSGALERKSMHTACPVVKGTKWSAAKWIHVGKYAVAGEKPVAIDQTLNPVPKTNLPGGKTGAASCIRGSACSKLRCPNRQLGGRWRFVQAQGLWPPLAALQAVHVVDAVHSKRPCGKEK